MTFDDHHESFLFQVGEDVVGLDRASLANFIYKSGLSLDELTASMRIAAGMKHPATYFRAMMKPPAKGKTVIEQQEISGKEAREKYELPDDAIFEYDSWDRVRFYKPGTGELLIMKFGDRAGEIQVSPRTLKEKGLE